MTPLEAPEDFLESYSELCDDLQDNDIQYQKYNLDSPYHTIKRALETLNLIIKKKVDMDWVGNNKFVKCVDDCNAVYDPELTKEEFGTLKELFK